MVSFGEEPLELRRSLGARAAPGTEALRTVLAESIAVCVAEQVSESCPQLLGDADVRAICRGYERELWLWLVGERTWEQCADGLLGRVLRRCGRSS